MLAVNSYQQLASCANPVPFYSIVTLIARIKPSVPQNLIVADLSYGRGKLHSKAVLLYVNKRCHTRDVTYEGFSLTLLLSWLLLVCAAPNSASHTHSFFCKALTAC